MRVIGGWNAAKKVAGLETYTQAEGNKRGIQPKPPGVEVTIDADWTELTPQQRWYYKNREHRIAVKDRRREELKQWLYEYKRDECICERCGEGFPGALDFHHPGTKEADISVLTNHGYSQERIITEIDRCDVLCANCHQKEHFALTSEELATFSSEIDIREGPWKHPDFTGNGSERRRQLLRMWVLLYKEASGGCARCDETDPMCLEFHHLDNDRENSSIGRMIAYESPRERFLREFGKCEIICRNCHRMEHYDVPESTD